MLIARFDDKENGVAAEARQVGPTTFEVEVIDTDADYIVGIKTGFKTADSAIDFARKCAGQENDR